MGVNPTAAAALKTFKQRHSPPPQVVDITRKQLAPRRAVSCGRPGSGAVMTPTICSICSDADITLATQTHGLRSRRRAFTDVVPANRTELKETLWMDRDSICLRNPTETGLTIKQRRLMMLSSPSLNLLACWPS